MNLNMIRPKNETEDLLLSMTRNCEALIDQTHRKAEETLEFKITKPRETFHFNSPVEVKEGWMIGLVNLKVYNSIYNKTEKNIKFHLYTDTFDDLSFRELKEELEEIVGIPNILNEHLQDEELATHIISVFRELQTEKRMTDG